MRKILEVKQEYERIWLANKGVVAVGIGNTSKGEPGIIISVKKITLEIQKQIPAEIKGVPIEIQETGEIKAL